jgi:hypothetical protein
VHKATIPLRDALWFRALCAVPIRLFRELLCALKPGEPLRLRFRMLEPNYDVFWASDSDACSSLDPHEVLLWFRSRGWTSPSHPTLLRRLLVRNGAIEARKPPA